MYTSVKVRAVEEKAWLREASASYKKRKAVRSVHFGCPKFFFRNWKMKVSMNPLVFVFVILELSSFNVDCQVEPVAPYITFRGIVLQNHSYINFYRIRNSVIDGVQCHTDLTTCCNSSYGPHGGRWYATGRALDSYSSAQYYSNALYQREFHQGLAILSDSRSWLSRYSNRLYRCDIDTNASTDGGRNDTDVSRRESVYVGIYSSGG